MDLKSLLKSRGRKVKLEAMEVEVEGESLKWVRIQKK